MINKVFGFLLLFTLIQTAAVAQSQFEERDIARQVADSAVTSADEQKEVSSPSPLSRLGDEYTNSIELLRNRFRIDYNVDEVTMVFFREYGSAPVVLVRPDGSKIFQGRLDEEKIKWFDADTFDMITIKNPVPGPWQAVGQVLPESRIMVLSDVQLHAEPLPNLVFAGEILKSTAYLTNDGKPIENKQFRDVVDLDIELISTNNPNYNNFGAGIEAIATFEDNGRGMDERPGDGVFTGQFNLKVASGEWKPIFRVTTPMYTREQVGEPIILHQNPVKIDVVIDDGEGYHKVIIDVDRELVDIESLLIDGKVRFPNSDIQNFSLTEGGSEAREHLVVSYEEGTFRVKLTAYGTTVDGRDFILDVPEYTFLARSPEAQQEEPIDAANATEVMPENDLEASIASSMEPPTDVAMANQDDIDDETLTLLLVAINGSIVLIGVLTAVVIIVLRKRKTKNTNTAAVSASFNSSEDKLTMDNEPKGIKKLLGLFKKKKAEEKNSDE